MKWWVFTTTLLLAASKCLSQDTSEASVLPWDRYNNPNTVDYNSNKEQNDYNRGQNDLNRVQQQPNDYNKDNNRENIYGGFNYRPNNMQSDSVILKEA